MKSNYSVRVRHWLYNVVKQRKRLIRSNKSLKPAGIVDYAINQIQMYLATYAPTDLNMARWLSRQKHLVQDILPGKSSNNFKTRQQQLQSFLDEGEQIISTNKMLKKFYETST